MANQSLLDAFDPLQDSSSPSPPSTPAARDRSLSSDERKPLTLSTYFNRPHDKRRATPSPKRENQVPSLLHPLVQVDDSPIDNSETENSDSVSDFRVKMEALRQNTADDLLNVTPHAAFRIQPPFGESTASLDTFMIPDMGTMGMSLNNSTMTSLLRIPAPPQLAQSDIERPESATSSFRSPVERDLSLDNSSLLDLTKLNDGSFDILRDDVSFLRDSNVSLDEFQPLDTSTSSTEVQFATVTRRKDGRPSHAIIVDDAMFGAADISPVKPRTSISPERGEVTAPTVDGTPVISPTRKSRFSFMRRDKSGSSTPRSLSPEKPSSPVTPSPLLSPRRSSSFLDIFRSSTSDSGKRSKGSSPETSKAVTPLPSKPPSPVNDSPTGTVTATRRLSSKVEQTTDEHGAKVKSPVRPAPSRTTSVASTKPATPAKSRPSSVAATITNTRVPASSVVDSSKSPSRRFSIRPPSTAAPITTRPRASTASSVYSSSNATKVPAVTRPSTLTSTRANSVAASRVPASSVPTSAPAPKVTFKAPLPPRKIATIATKPATAAPAKPAAASSSSAAASAPSHSRTGSKLSLPSIRPRPSAAAGISPTLPKAKPATTSRLSTFGTGAPTTSTVRLAGARQSVVPPSTSTGATGSNIGHVRSKSLMPTSLAGTLGKTSAPATSAAGVTRSNSMALPSTTSNTATTSKLLAPGIRRTLVKPPPSSAGKR